MNEALIIGVVIAILCGAACMYLYYCITYLEKKMGVMESILVDVRMTLDSLLLSDRSAEEGGAAGGVPISSALPPPMPAATVFTAPEPMPASESESIPEERFYSSVLEQAHEAAAATGGDGGAAEEQGGVGAAAAVTAETQSLEQVLQSIQATETAVSEEEGHADGPVVSASAGTNYDTLTRAELLALAEKRGVRVKRSSSRNEIISVLRRTETHSIASSSAGTENASEPAGSLFPNGDSVDGGFPVDLGQSDGAMGGTEAVSA